jgi:protein-S-isoprenylcysteine O-methyltransferase Ste14
MTLPFATYLVMFLMNLPVSLADVLSAFFAPHPILIAERVFIVVGLLLVVCSAVYLRMKRKVGLVTSGPYRLTRHPQYLGLILATLGLNSLSIWILRNTFGRGFLNPSQTAGVWFTELFAYILLALVEELFLSRNYGEDFKNYTSQVPFFIPFLKTNRHGLDILISILVPTFLLFGLLVIGGVSPI